MGSCCLGFSTTDWTDWTDCIVAEVSCLRRGPPTFVLFVVETYWMWEVAHRTRWIHGRRLLRDGRTRITRITRISCASLHLWTSVPSVGGFSLQEVLWVPCVLWESLFSHRFHRSAQMLVCTELNHGLNGLNGNKGGCAENPINQINPL